jgi:hypothetical protein
LIKTEKDKPQKRPREKAANVHARPTRRSRDN